MDIIVEDKTLIREEIGQAVAAFLKGGGKVEKHPIYSGSREGGLYGDFAKVMRGEVEKAGRKRRGSSAWVPEDGYVNCRQIAGMVGLTDTTLRRMAQRGDLPPACKIGHKKTQWWRIERVQHIIDKLKAKRQVQDA